MTRQAYIVTGQVQGVGFRPFVYRCAMTLGLTGRVGNTAEGVRIEVQGGTDALALFEHELRHSLPPLAKINSLECQAITSLPNEQGFVIVSSSHAGHSGHQVLVSPDTAVCDQCLSDLLDSSNRRFAYAFTNCTDCGPRYTITRSIPYDRPFTSMACFPLCASCQAEYDNPLDRRFHAQPNACPDCGPQVWFENAENSEHPGVSPQYGHAAILAVVEALQAGKIAAIKGLGGFHLACSAMPPPFASDAVTTLRQRKHRPHKALAIMVPNLESARQFVELDEEAERALLSPRRPIVVCPRRATPLLAQNLAPDTHTLGVMLPYTPLHHLLFRPELLRQALGKGGESFAKTPAPLALVMTSGNAGGEPICLGNREAKERLQGIADVFLFHNRDILVRVDDSVVFAGTAKALDQAPPITLRRARGFVPEALALPSLEKAPHCVLGVGAQLKHTFCLTRQQQAFVSQHIGDLEHPAALDFFAESLAHMLSLLEVQPQLIVRDAHPDYPSSHLANRVASQFANAMGQSAVPVLPLQHHFAHIHAVLAEYKQLQPVLGLALDGSGLGSDGSIWGGELLVVDPLACSTLPDSPPSANGPGHFRLGHFAPFSLPGGEKAIREPWRLAESMLIATGVSLSDALLPWRNSASSPELAPDHIVAMLREMVRRKLHCPITTSCGRLFDAIASLCGVCHVATYEGQAAIRLEAAQDFRISKAYTAPVLEQSGMLVLDTHTLFRQAVSDMSAKPGVMARRFHVGLAQSLAHWARAGADITGITTVALAGGVFNNRTLATELPAAMQKLGLTPLLPRLFPVGDGAIALGQAAWGRLQLI